jgi:hypothetical protein
MKKINIKELGKEEYKSPHIEWVASELDDWAETFDDFSEPEDLEVGAETHEEVRTKICGYAQKIRNEETLTKEETDEVFFHLWQKSHEQEE